ncbi:thiamine pyrophosphate-binding protein [Actinokineospora sp. 24-640]
MRTLAAAVGRALADSGVRHAFGVVGNGNIYAVEALVANGVEYVAARHEGGAITMADAYHRATGEVAVCTTTYGPGLTNVATGLAEAAKHRSGVLVLCGDRPEGTPPRPTDIDQSAFVETLGAHAVRVTDASQGRAAAVAALELARAGHAVVLCLPDDLLLAAVPEDGAVVSVPAAEPAGAGDVDALVALLAQARKPLLLGGLGAWRSGAGPAIAELAERVSGLLATSVMGDGLFAGNPWSVGICGGFATPRAAELIREADLVVAFGASLNHFTLHGGELPHPDATLVRVDLAGARPSPRVDIDITGDAAATAAALLERLRPSPSRWREEVSLAGTAWADIPHDEQGTDDRIDPRTLVKALGELLPAERTLVTDGGHFVGWPIMYWPVPDPAALVFTGASFMSIGLGLAGGVGAAAARPDRTAVIAVGDGGALMGLPELETLVRTAESALVVVFDDAAYGWEVHVYGDQTNVLDTIAFGDTDFAGVARALGARAATVRTVDDLAAVRAWRDSGARGTLVLDCKVVPQVVAGYLADLRARLRAGAATRPAPGLPRAA